MPTRYLKPGIRDSELIESLSPMAECLFYRLLVTVDDFGRYDGRPALVRAHCFPIKSISNDEVAALLEELARSTLVTIYVVDEKPFLQVAKWDNVPRSKVSKFPRPEDGSAHSYTDARIPSALLPVTGTGTGTETGNRKPTTAPTRKRVRANEQSEALDLDVDPELLADWKTAFPAVPVEEEIRRAVAWLRANPANRKSNYERFLVNWLTKAQDRAPRVASGSATRQVFSRGGIPIDPGWYSSIPQNVIDLEGSE